MRTEISPWRLAKRSFSRLVASATAGVKGFLDRLGQIRGSLAEEFADVALDLGPNGPCFLNGAIIPRCRLEAERKCGLMW